MQYQHIGYRLQGFYKMAHLNNKWEAIMGTTAHKKLEAIEFWDKYGINATLDSFNISRATMYRWRKLYREKVSRHCATVVKHHTVVAGVIGRHE